MGVVVECGESRDIPKGVEWVFLIDLKICTPVEGYFRINAVNVLYTDTQYAMHNFYHFSCKWFLTSVIEF